MVLNEIIEQAGRQSRASDQNGTTKPNTLSMLLPSNNAFFALFDFILPMFDVLYVLSAL